MNAVRSLVLGFCCFAAAAAIADDLIPEGAKNIATTSGAKTITYENVYTGGGTLFDGVRNRWLGKAPNPATDYYPSEKVTFTEATPVVNAYRVYRGSVSAYDDKQVRQATEWELYGSNDGSTWTLLHAQTDPVQWYDGRTAILDHFDCVFDNNTAYSAYWFRVTANGGDQYAAIDDVGLYFLVGDDVLLVEHNGFEIGNPSPAYGSVTGLKAGDPVELSMADTRVVNSATSHRYELRGFTIMDADGNVLHEGTTDELPYVYTHGEHGAKVVWNWADLHEEFVAAQTKSDLTVPENADYNEITDAMMDGSPVVYYDGNPREVYGPQKLFDNGTGTSNRWFPYGVAPYYAQYVFKQDGEAVPRMVTGLKVGGGGGGRDLYAFDFEASNDGESWTKLLSVDSETSFTSGSWTIENAETYSTFRFVVRRKTNSQLLDLRTLEFYSYRGADVLEILGKPAYGKPDPDYGFISGLAEGDRRTLAAPTDEIIVSDDEKSVCTGYTLVVDGAEPVDYAGTTCEYVHSGKGTALTWNFASTYRHRVGVKGAGSVDCAADFFAAGGTELTITATPDGDDQPFLEWRGDVPEGQSADNPVLTFTVDRPRSLTAVFAAPTYVSATGDDANDGSSWEKAVRTVSRALELCGGMGKVCFGEGEFAAKPGVLNITHGLRLTGLGPDKSVIVADNTEGNGTLLAVSHASAVVDGVCVKGAVAASGNGAGIFLSAGTVTNCWIEGCSAPGNGGGVWLNGTGLLVDSVVSNCTAENVAGGVYVTGGTFLCNRVTGCSAPSCGGACFDVDMTVADSAFRGNSATSGNGGAVGCGSTLSSLVFTNCIFEANVASSRSGIIDQCPVAVAFESCLFAGNRASGYCGIGMSFKGKIRHSRLVGNCGGNGYGGALDLRSGGRLENSLVTGTVGGDGVVSLYADGGMWGVIRNCTVVSNRCATSGALTGGGTVRNSILAENYSGSGLVLSNWTDSAENAVYCCIPGHDPSVLGEGSIAADPRFASAEKGDYTLRWNSPCVNAGSNSFVTEGEVDLAGNPRIRRFGGRAKHDIVDMGCYESPFRHTKGLQLMIR